jgi:hypothetical protein
VGVGLSEANSRRCELVHCWRVQVVRTIAIRVQCPLVVGIKDHDIRLLRFGPSRNVRRRGQKRNCKCERDGKIRRNGQTGMLQVHVGFPKKFVVINSSMTHCNRSGHWLANEEHFKQNDEQFKRMTGFRRRNRHECSVYSLVTTCNGNFVRMRLLKTYPYDSGASHDA